MLALPLHLFAVSALLCPPQHAGYRWEPLRPGAARCTAVMASSWYDAGIRLDTAAEQRAAPSDPAGRWPGWWDKSTVAEENPAFATWLSAEAESPEALAAPSAPPSAAPDCKWTASKVRSQFIEFFESKGHTMVPSSPVVPYDDPTLLFANAGMNQFKPLFVGQAQPGSALAELGESSKRATNTQKCIRAGGKHNDLEDVGMDTYHHTFFEMLGSWSFGDYFKQEAVAWAWELFTVVYGLPVDRFYATYFEGDEELGLAPDEEARQLWLQYLPAERVLPGNKADNFWEMGDTGPCGPCSEIHYDRIGGRDAAALVNMDDPDVLEVWNLVFMQFNREDGGELRPLPAKSVDTGMGFERLVSILQDVRSNYDTDVFAPIFGEIQRLTGVPPYGGELGGAAEVLPQTAIGRDTAYRVIADHIRTLSVSIADGAVPSNEGRGYVLRRILRRAVRYGRQMLGAEEGFFAELVPAAIASLSEAFPELEAQQPLVQRIIAEEEASFSSMLSRGIKEFNARAQAIKATGEAGFDGQAAFFLYDSMGFPLDLTELMAREVGLEVDTAGFQAAMDEQKARSASAAAASKGEGARLTLGPEQTSYLADSGVAFTDDQFKFARDDRPQPAALRAIYSGAGFVDEADADADATLGLLLDRTSFFSQAGGQVPDVGSIVSLDGGATFRVSSVQSFGGYVLHVGALEAGSLATGAALECRVDWERRQLVSKSHTLTHVLNLALHEVLGEGVSQKGSLVDPSKARFDFAHSKAMTPDECQRVEQLVNVAVQAQLPVHIETVPLDKALEINNLRAVFGERYPDPVRVVSIGPTIDQLLAAPASGEWQAYSIELCGGTHIATSAELGAFALVEEAAVAKGVRRVVGVTGALASAALKTGEALKARQTVLTSADVDAAGAEAVEEARREMNEIKLATDAATMSVYLKAEVRAAIGAHEKRLLKRAKQLSAGQSDRAAAAAVALAQAAAAAGQKFVVLELDGVEAKGLQPLVQKVIKQTGLATIALSLTEGKVACLASVPEDRVGALPANTWLQTVLKEVSGRGGGKPAQAQGSGPEVANLAKAVEVASQVASEAFGA